MAVKIKNLIFIHVPKTAGISIGQAILNDPSYKGEHNRVNKKYSGKEWNKFMVCRNPYDRLISAYEYQKKMADLGIGLGFQQRKFLKERKGATFSNFVNFIFVNKRQDELHTRPQKYWMQYLDGSPIKDLKIIRFENLEEEITKYFFQIEMNVPVFKNINSSIRLDFFEYYSNPTVISQVQKLYSQDFKIFGYSQDINIAANGKS